MICVFSLILSCYFGWQSTICSTITLNTCNIYTCKTQDLVYWIDHDEKLKGKYNYKEYSLNRINSKLYESYGCNIDT